MNYLFWYKITVQKKQGEDVIDYLVWDNLRFDVRNKWTWYFEYRSALLKVKYPKYLVKQSWGRIEVTELSTDEQKALKNKSRSIWLKGRITTFRRAIEKYECEEKQKLIPDWENKKYIRTKEKLKEFETELNQLTNYKNIEV